MSPAGLSFSPDTFPPPNPSKVFPCFLEFSYREQSVGNAQGNLGNNQLSLNHLPHILWESPLFPWDVSGHPARPFSCQPCFVWES